VIEPAEIDRFFVPRPRADIAFVELDGEAVIAATAGDDGRLLTHWLNPIGTIVWQCFDGVASLDELIAELASAFGASPDIVANDVVELARALGRSGLLEDVTAQLSLGGPAGDGYQPEGLPLGSEVPPFSRRDLDGYDVGLGDLRGRRLVLVNWSPSCGFCAAIAPELAALHADLRAHGAELVLLAFGSADDNRSLLDQAGLTCTVLLQGDDAVDLFRGLGTPCAYLVDEHGAIASGLAVGANQVPGLARLAAGHGRE
jgi:thiol-disulfide isomerase/thioredoxin